MDAPLWERLVVLARVCYKNNRQRSRFLSAAQLECLLAWQQRHRLLLASYLPERLDHRMHSLRRSLSRAGDAARRRGMVVRPEVRQARPRLSTYQAIQVGCMLIQLLTPRFPKRLHMLSDGLGP